LGIKILVLVAICLIPLFIVPAFAATYSVSIPEGSGDPGCEETNECFSLYLITIEVGDTVTWTNDDSVAHTVTSGNPTYGPDGVFDSSLFMAGRTFSHSFDSSGLVAYYDVVHPWMQGIVRVIEGDSNEEKKITINQEPKEGTTDQESDVCSSSASVSLMGPIHIINFKYKVETNLLYSEYGTNQGFEEYLTGINYEKSEKVSNYVNSILESKEFAIFYFEKNLSSEDEKLMIQVSEKYLEYLYDGKNRFISDTNALYTDKKSEINAIPMQDSRLTICGDDKIEGLEELETTRTATKYMINQNISSFIEDWEKNLQIKKQSFQLDDSDTIEQTTSEKIGNIPDFVKTGQIGLKKGDWVKYKLDISGEGGFGGLIDMMMASYVDPNTGCTYSEIDLIKYEVIKMDGNIPTLKPSSFCNGVETELDILPVESVFLHFIPVDVKVGDVISGTETGDERKVVGMEKRNYGGKTVDVVKVHSEETETFENGGSSSISIITYHEKLSGMMLELDMSFETTRVPIFGDSNLAFGLNAIDYNISRSSNNLTSGGGCLIATAAYGSELAPQVQMLREIRDNSLLQTQSGQSFMQGFNSFYYSFSPTIADYERQNPIFKEAVKLTITPLVASLSLLNYVDLDSEESVLGYGIGIILMNIGMYFIAPAIVIFRIKNR